MQPGLLHAGICLKVHILLFACSLIFKGCARFQHTRTRSHIVDSFALLCCLLNLLGRAAVGLLRLLGGGGCGGSVGGGWAATLAVASNGGCRSAGRCGGCVACAGWLSVTCVRALQCDRFVVLHFSCRAHAPPLLSAAILAGSFEPHPRARGHLARG